MTRVRRREAIRERQQEPSADQRVQMALDHEVARARMYRASPGQNDRKWCRDERWWAEVGNPALKRRSEQRWVSGTGWVHFPGINDDPAPGGNR